MNKIKNLFVILFSCSVYIGCGSLMEQKIKEKDIAKNLKASTLDDSYKFKGISVIEGSWNIENIFFTHSISISDFRENRSNIITQWIINNNKDYDPSFIISNRSIKVSNRSSKIKYAATHRSIQIVDEDDWISCDLENPNRLILFSKYKQMRKFFPYLNFYSENVYGDNLKDLNSGYYAIVLTKK